jgi:hypothetical protein
MFYLRAAAAGFLFALGVIVVALGRIVFTVTAGHRWGQLKQLGKAYK